MNRNSRDSPKQFAPFQNTLSQGLFRFFLIVIAFLLITDLSMFFIKGEIHPLFEDLTKILIGAFVGMVTTVIAFYFGDPNIKVPPHTLRGIRDEIERQEQPPPDRQSHREDT